MPPESSETRMGSMEQTLYEMNARLSRSEEAAHQMYIRNQIVTETLGRVLQFNQELSRTVLSLFPSESPHYRDGLCNTIP